MREGGTKGGREGGREGGRDEGYYPVRSAGWGSVTHLVFIFLLSALLLQELPNCFSLSIGWEVSQPFEISTF